jgi:acyl-CoA dehydrogenase
VDALAKCVAMPTTSEPPVTRIFTDMRAFRIDNGPSEVHRWNMARKLVHLAEQAGAAE